MVDESLGGSAENVDVFDEDLAGSVDVSTVSEPEDFDFDAFVSGARPGRRAVRVVPRADLMAELALISAEAEQADDDTANVLMERFVAVKEQILSTSRMFVLEARSDKRISKIIKSAGVEPGRKATEAERTAWQDEVALLRLVDSIVVPSGVTREGLERLRETAPSEYVKLWNTHVETITDPTRGLGVDPNFSLRR